MKHLFQSMYIKFLIFLFFMIQAIDQENPDTLEIGKVRKQVQELRKEFGNKKIIYTTLNDTNIQYFQNLLLAYDELLKKRDDIFLLIVEPVPIVCSDKMELTNILQSLKLKNDQKVINLRTPKTEPEHHACMAVANLAVFVDEYSVCCKFIHEFITLNQSNIIVEMSNAIPFKANRVNFSNIKETVETIGACLQEPNNFHQENLEILKGLQSVDFLASAIADPNDCKKEMKIPEYLTEHHQINLINEFKRARSRAIILDYDGTLTEIVSKPENAFPTKEIKELLYNLGNLKNTELALCTGRRRQDMDEWFPYYRTNVLREKQMTIDQQNTNDMTNQKSGTTSDDKHKECDNIKHKDCNKESDNNKHKDCNKERDNTVFEIPMTIFAEHTAAKRVKSQWIERSLNLSFMPRTLELMTEYQRRLPGSKIEKKDTGIVFHYRGCEFADSLVDDLRISLTKELGDISQINQGKKIIEVNCKNIKKDYCVRQYKDKEFILMAGDDRTDEDMFSVGHNSILIGNRPSYARYRVDEPEDFRRFLKRLWMAAVE
ncbi:trehalose-phosphatase [Pseudoloma neurophilia]|uniref:Trehalose-phosphatase n=1 Tax=Pseudoloma neurophilia TaxID=146866 RepID=A0A0R0LZY8_9MICR|nr:trehalose-phosphatase [Pseudoloma neurophilia]